MDYRILAAGDEGVLPSAVEGLFDRPIRRDLALEFLADPRHHIAVALDNGRVVAYASGLTYLHPDKPLELWVNEVAVAEGWRRRGIGKRTLALLLEYGRALGCGEAWVLTEADNLPASRLYAGLGGRRKAQTMYAFELEGGW